MEETKGCNMTNNYYYGCCGNGNTGSSKEVYSFDEIEIGSWVDGKTIYRKVIEGKLANASGDGLVLADVTELKIERMINLHGNMIDNVGKAHIVMQTSFNYPEGIKAAVNMYYDSIEKKLRYHFLHCEGLYSGCTAYVTLEYTKQDEN